jgi:hypothetical protein
MFIVQTEPVPIIYLYYTQRHVYCYVYDWCIFLIPDFIILMHVITRSEYTITYIDVDSLLDLYRNRIKSASKY